METCSIPNNVLQLRHKYPDEQRAHKKIVHEDSNDLKCSSGAWLDMRKHPRIGYSSCYAATTLGRSWCEIWHCKIVRLFLRDSSQEFFCFHLNFLARGLVIIQSPWGPEIVSLLGSRHHRGRGPLPDPYLQNSIPLTPTTMSVGSQVLFQGYESVSPSIMLVGSLNPLKFVCE